jgi:hypothetical protein
MHKFTGHQQNTSSSSFRYFLSEDILILILKNYCAIFDLFVIQFVEKYISRTFSKNGYY